MFEKFLKGLKKIVNRKKKTKSFNTRKAPTYILPEQKTTKVEVIPQIVDEVSTTPTVSSKTPYESAEITTQPQNKYSNREKVIAVKAFLSQYPPRSEMSNEQKREVIDYLYDLGITKRTKNDWYEEIDYLMEESDDINIMEQFDEALDDFDNFEKFDSDIGAVSPFAGLFEQGQGIIPPTAFIGGR